MSLSKENDLLFKIRSQEKLNKTEKAYMARRLGGSGAGSSPENWLKLKSLIIKVPILGKIRGRRGDKNVKN